MSLSMDLSKHGLKSVLKTWSRNIFSTWTVPQLRYQEVIGLGMDSGSSGAEEDPSLLFRGIDSPLYLQFLPDAEKQRIYVATQTADDEEVVRTPDQELHEKPRRKPGRDYEDSGARRLRS
ncbi:hypothetical protein VNI00_011125 [Paramarasmius palmivorus]|uniref:Uncharacterized protein n=1 Tax=Paramarasmius palmivorus TaxID=297713 RepID=A0AAW0CD57_9AGAR